ncbi:MAG TPA: hypothetical protein VFF27_04085, partial [Bacteroidia bacterium]|nr:hypothetical protein [Bacteroidia bacterium]
MNKLLLLLFIPCFIQAQKCRYDVDTYDKFQKIRKTEKEIKVVKKFNHGNGYLTLRLCKYGDNSFFRLYTASNDNMIVGRGDTAILLLSNEESIKAHPSQSFFSEYNGARYLFEGTYLFS